jgi:hypothetical protein
MFFNYFSLIRILGWVVVSEVSLLGTLATNWSILPAPADCESGEFCGMNIGRENRSTRIKLAQHNFLHHKSYETRSAALGSQRLTALAMARPMHLQNPAHYCCYCSHNFVRHLTVSLKTDTISVPCLMN